MNFRNSSGFVLLTVLSALFWNQTQHTQAIASSKIRMAPSTQAQPAQKFVHSHRIAYRATDRIRQMALALANRDRAKQGLTPLVEDRLLSSSAELHAIDMLRRDFFDHYNPGGQSPSNRFVALGGRGKVAENIGYIYLRGSRLRINGQLLSRFEERWMKSAYHRKHLLNAQYRRFGYGIAVSPRGDRVYAVQTFTR
jgi:uncharacterized protein YkwD